MTIPIIPGPFSFLAEAGEAAGSIGRGLELRRQRARQELQDQLTIVEQGGDVPLPNFLKTANRAGLQLNEGSATQLFEMAKRRAAAAIKTTEANASVAGSNAIISGANAGVAPEMAQEGLNTARANTRSAQAGATTAEAQASVAGDIAKSQRAQALMQQEIYNQANVMLGNNPELQKIASYAAVGGLPFLVQQIENNRLYNTELRNDARLLMQAMSQVQMTYSTALKEWMDNLTTEAFKQNVNLADEGEAQKFLSVYEQSFPRPDRMKIQDEVLGTFGMTSESFKEASGRVFPRIFGSSQTAKPGAAGAGTGAATPTGGGPNAKPGQETPEGGEQSIDLAAGLLAQGQTKEVARQFVESVKRGTFSPLEVRAILARAKAKGYADSLIKLIKLELRIND